VVREAAKYASHEYARRQRLVVRTEAAHAARTAAAVTPAQHLPGRHVGKAVGGKAEKHKSAVVGGRAKHRQWWRTATNPTRHSNSLAEE